jgi:hypothetical protein
MMDRSADTRLGNIIPLELNNCRQGKDLGESQDTLIKRRSSVA